MQFFEFLKDFQVNQLVGGKPVVFYAEPIKSGGDIYTDIQWNTIEIIIIESQGTDFIELTECL